VNQPVDLAARVAAIELLLLDVDGVLTDGSVIYTDDGTELKRFHVRDGSGLKLWHAAGKRSAIISGRKSAAVERRAKELGIHVVLQGRDDKLAAFTEVLASFELQPEQVCAIGDDLPDLPVLLRCGIAMTVADACPEVRSESHFITTASGGQGAVREAVEQLLKLQGRWAEIITHYLGDSRRA